MKLFLIMGLPGAGKTTLANMLAPKINAKRLNADEVRNAANDWDFSADGRKRQAKRMADFALKLKKLRLLQKLCSRLIKYFPWRLNICFFDYINEFF